MPLMAALASCVLLTGCPLAKRHPEPLAAAAPRPERLHAVLVNGGGRREINFQSHLTNVHGVVELLEESGVPPGNIAVFSSDGSDPTADLATRETADEPQFWLLPPSLARALRPPVTYVDSTLDGFVLHPATREALRAWFLDQGSELGKGDTLLFYVTDHGEKNEDDLTDNEIVLWKEKLEVSELRELLALLDPDVRVVMLMSQCFSGSFGNAVFRTADDLLPAGNVCGYFSSTADRPAYGCYPENRGKNGIGHSHEFLEALQPLGDLPEAEKRVLTTDDTPDVPHASTDFFLSRLLERAAKENGEERTAYVDELIAEAWENEAEWEPQIRLLDRIGQTFGIFSPRSLGELERQAEILPVVSDRLHTYAQRWRQALDALLRANLQRFLEANPEWKKRLIHKRLAKLDAAGRRRTATQLLDELAPFTRRDRETQERIDLLKKRADDAAAARYRMEVRLGVVLRMRSVLTSVAGREYLRRYGTEAERQAFRRLQSCEDLSLHPAVATAADLAPPAGFPSLADDQQLVEAVMPAWMGIRYRPLAEIQRRRDVAAAGAVAVLTVFPDSAASRAGLKVADIILGPPGRHFVEPNQVREWTMRREVGEPASIDVARGHERLRLTLEPDPYPLEMPELPGPPKVGSIAPPLDLKFLRGKADVGAGKSRLLFFWATWCLPCKFSVPEVLAFARRRHVEVIAITDENPVLVRKFLAGRTEPFPRLVATDRYRITFQSYGVSGTPTFVLIGADGKVEHYATGYDREKGLDIQGWQWKKPPPKAVSQR
jgi:thiol-disulfide isomerase/thioredoxin